MKTLSATLLAIALVFGMTAVTVDSAPTQKTEKFTCVFDENNPFPDGTTGIAEVGVKVTGNGNTVVNVDYFSDGYEDYLGKYQERNGDFVPQNHDEACQFAYEHYGDRE